jgi:stress response protein YsnF
VEKSATKLTIMTMEPNPEATDAQNIQLYGEVLRVQKDRVSRGEVRLRKEVTTTTQTVEVPVIREELVLERAPVSGQVPATARPDTAPY